MKDGLLIAGKNFIFIGDGRFHRGGDFWSVRLGFWLSIQVFVHQFLNIAALIIADDLVVLTRPIDLLENPRVTFLFVHELFDIIDEWISQRFLLSEWIFMYHESVLGKFVVTHGHLDLVGQGPVSR